MGVLCLPDVSDGCDRTAPRASPGSLRDYLTELAPAPGPENSGDGVVRPVPNRSVAACLYLEQCVGSREFRGGIT